MIFAKTKHSTQQKNNPNFKVTRMVILHNTLGRSTQGCVSKGSSRRLTREGKTYPNLNDTIPSTGVWTE